MPRQPDRGAGGPSFPFTPRPGNGPPPFGPIGHDRAVVDLNAASLAELETLPAITPDYARKIIAGRPYHSMADLRHAGIPDHIVEQISPPAIIIERESPGLRR
jgi:hypothetical protein